MKARVSIRGFDPLRSTLPAPALPAIPEPCGRKVELPCPPSVNEAYRNSTKGEIARGFRGRRKTETYKKWVKDAELLIRSARMGNFASPVKVTIRVGKVNQARDLDNLIKCTLDTLVWCGVIRTDNLTCVHSVQIERAFGAVPDGWVSVEVELV